MSEEAEAFGGDWLEALSEAAVGIDADPDVRVVIEQVVGDAGDPGDDAGPTGGDNCTGSGGENSRSWTVAVTDGRVAVGSEQTTDPTIRLSCDRATAEGIHEGTISASAAFLDGRLRIGGDWRRLMAHREILAGVARQLHRGPDAS